MAKSNAERQAAYRLRHVIEGEAERLNAVVSVSAKRQLERLSRHHGVTQRAMLEQLLAAAERKVVDRLKVGDQRAYYNVTA